MSVWSPARYGWGVVYWLTVEGIPVVFIEKATGLSLPSGFSTQDASLVIDRSSEVGQEVDRETGLGQGMPLTFHLLDTSTVRTWLRRHSYEARLTANVTTSSSVAFTINVDSTSGWPSSGALYLGSERITYTGTTRTSFTGCLGGQAGSLTNKHYKGTLGGIASDLPRWWRGRQIRLMASPVDPAGYMTGTSLDDEAEEVWRGTIDLGPVRAGSLWEFVCQSLDRKLDLPVVAPLTGTVAEASARYPVNASQSFAIHIGGWDNAGAKVWEFWVPVDPYNDLSDGSLLTVDEQIERITSAWSTAVTTAKNITTGATDGTTYLGALKAMPVTQDFYAQGNNSDTPTIKAGTWAWYLNLVTDASTTTVGATVEVNGKKLGPQLTWTPAYTPSTLKYMVWNSGPNILASSAKEQANPAGITGLAVELDTPIDALPSSGILQVGDWYTSYSSATLITGTQVAYLTGLSKAKVGPLPADLVGKSAEIIFRTGGSFADVMRRLLTSSGFGSRSTFDTLAYGQGYGLRGQAGVDSAVDEDSFAALANGPLTDLQADVRGSGQSFAEVFGGSLALAQRSIVARGDTGTTGGKRRVRLGLVSTEPGGSAYLGVVDDTMLLIGDGEPVQAIHRGPPPNTIEIQLAQGDDDGDRYILTDEPAVHAQGSVSVSYTLPISNKPIQDVASAWASSRFAASQTAQELELHLVPWALDDTLDVGDLIYLDTQHYAVWSWSTGTVGYSGTARVLGVRRRLLDGALTVKVIIDGSTLAPALCPAAEVQAFTGLATAPATIDVEQRFYKHFSKTLELGSDPFTLKAYDPGMGAENGNGTVSITDVEDTGTVCRLTVSGSSGVTLVNGQTYLTIPDLTTGNAYQDVFAHTGEGNWT